MKTTIEIPDALFRRAKSAAAERGISLQALVSEALTEKLSAHPSSEKPWMKAFGKLRGLRAETARIGATLDEEFGKIEPGEMDLLLDTNGVSAMTDGDSGIEAREPAVTAILCADWGVGKDSRSVYIADVASRVVRRIAPATPWTVDSLLRTARATASAAGGSVLVAIDAPLGLPKSYLTAAGAIAPWRSPCHFLEFLIRACTMPEFFEPTKQASQWRIERPFFAVPAGAGGLTGYRDASKNHGFDLYRDIDRKTGAKTVFAKSGIPGSVGSGACALWQELGPLLEDSNRRFKVWPFEGDLPVLLASSAVVLGEIYPRAAYATALLEGPVDARPPLVVAKTKAPIRSAAVAVLRSSEWVQRYGVTLENLVEAEASEDDFDACLTAAALLRCELEGLPLCPPHCDTIAVTEGGILGTGSINMDLPARTFPFALSRPALTPLTLPLTLF